jgi:hypothetical protein
MLMEYKFSIAWFVIGFLITCLGGVFMKYHQWVADNFGSGLNGYDRYKLAALIMIGFGLISMVNLHTVILGWIFTGLFSGIANG